MSENITINSAKAGENVIINMPKHAYEAIKRLNDNGYEAYAVGGCVRDSLLGRTPDDWDVCTNCMPDEIKAVFKDFQTLDIGTKHGTVTVVIENEFVEITTYRCDGEYVGHRKPLQVEFVTSLDEDLKRRDFTVNAMCCDIDGNIVDMYGGREDIDDKLIRCVGDASERFEEDALRILRGLRFASTLGFEIEPATKAAMFDKKQLLEAISAERVTSELKKLICGKSAERILLEYRDIFAVIIPEIEPCFDYEQNNPHHCYTVWEHIVKSVAAVRPEPMIRTTMLLHDIAKPIVATVDKNGISHFKTHPAVGADMATEILKRLRYDNRTISYIHDLILEHDNRIPASRPSVKRFISKHDFRFMFDYLEVRRGDTYAQSEYHREEKLRELDDIAIIALRLLSEDSCLKVSDLAVGGNDLMELGLSGKDIGDWLERLLELVIDDVIENKKQTLVDYVKENM